MNKPSEWQSNMGFDIRGPSQPRKFSCKRCQLRKLRCSRTEPCSNCQKSRQVCEYRDLTSRKRPAAKEYVVGLEKRVAWLESLVMRLKAASAEERDTMLEAVSLSDDLLTVGDQVPQMTDNRRTASRGLGSQHYLHGSFQIRPGGYLVYHGASSVFYALKEAKSLASKRRVRQSSHESVSSPSSSIYVGSGTDFNHVAQHFGIDMNDDLITKMLMQFFKWQYPYFMFIYREAFLRDHNGDRAGSPYWSTALVLSMCALGALTSDEESERLMSGQFFSAAETIAIVSGLARPSITTVQTFLCLAFYEIGRGEPSKAWGFSGIAFRMAQDLGFQKDPDHWVSHHALATVPEDIEIRRRIYWGCYCSDKIISLILGRPVQLYRADGEVHDRLVGLPDLPDIESWLPADMDSEKTYGPCHDHKSNQCSASFQEQRRLCQIIEKMLSSVFSARFNSGCHSKKACIDTINLELCRWQESLPNNVKCNKWEPSNTTLMMSVAALHMLYYSCRIILHFELAKNEGGAEAGDVSWEDAREICVAAVEDITFLTRRYRGQYGLRHASMIFVYGIVQAIRTARAFHQNEVEAEYLIQALEECSHTWALAAYDFN